MIIIIIPFLLGDGGLGQEPGHCRAPPQLLNREDCKGEGTGGGAPREEESSGGEGEGL